jgi:hypothetical protein
MTAEQRWLFDTQGFLHLRAALDPAELAAAQRAADAYIRAHAPPAAELERADVEGRAWPEGFGAQRAMGGGVIRTPLSI